jgi:glutamate transport system substrate-binding protein
MRGMVRSLALLCALSLVVGACGDDDDDGDGKAATKKTTTTTTKKVAPAFAAGTTMAALKDKSKIVVGTKFDQPGFGLKNATTGKVEGFDVEIAKLIAAGLFGGTADEAEKKIEFVETVSKNREPFIQEGKVDIVVATYTINDARKQVVDFAGPYFVARQDIMVKSDNTTIKGVKDLNGKKVCSVLGSTSLKNVQAQAPQADTSITFDIYSKCAEAMGDGRVEAVTTDDSILAGLVKSSGGAFKLVGAPFSEEPYGIGLKKGDQAFRDYLNDRLEEIYKSGEWVDAFQNTLGVLGLRTPQPPAVVRY